MSNGDSHLTIRFASPPLGEVVNPDALDALRSRTDLRIEIRFDYLGWK